MPTTSVTASLICVRCLFRKSRRWNWSDSNGFYRRSLSSTLPLEDQKAPAGDGQVQGVEKEAYTQNASEGAMSRRLAEITEETIKSGGRTAEKAMDEAGFSEDLRKKLEARIGESSFRHQNPSAFAQVDMPVRPRNTRAGADYL